MYTIDSIVITLLWCRKQSLHTTFFFNKCGQVHNFLMRNTTVVWLFKAQVLSKFHFSLLYLNLAVTSELMIDKSHLISCDLNKYVHKYIHSIIIYTKYLHTHIHIQICIDCRYTHDNLQTNSHTSIWYVIFKNHLSKCENC